MFNFRFQKIMQYYPGFVELKVVTRHEIKTEALALKKLGKSVKL